MDETNQPGGGRRRYARAPGPFQARCPGVESRDVLVMNLGMGGGFIVVSSGAAIGETFALQIDLGTEGVIDVSASTLYHTMNGSAVTFLNLAQDAFDRIRRTVERVGR